MTDGSQLLEQTLRKSLKAQDPPGSITESERMLVALCGRREVRQWIMEPGLAAIGRGKD